MALVKHGELTVQQVAHIEKHLITFANRETFWDKFCSHKAIEAGRDSVEWRKLNVPTLKPDQIKNLAEGETPASMKLEYVKFAVKPVTYGNYFEYTDESKRYNYDDVVADAKVVLAADAKDQSEIRIAQQYMSGTCTLTATNNFLNDLLKARTIFKKNKNIKPISGNKYGCILTPEKAAEVLVAYEKSITHTSQKEALINGYIGELGGFILFECGDDVMYTTESGTTYGYILFIGKTDLGMPVGTVAFGSDQIQVFDNGLGSVPTMVEGEIRPDALHRIGTVGYKRMGFATRIIADEAILRAKVELTPAVLTLDDADRQHYVEASASPKN